MLLWTSNCTQSEFYQSLTEKTKQLAQKCGHLRLQVPQSRSRAPAPPSAARPPKAAPSKPPRAPKSLSRWYVKQPTWRLWGEERTEGAIYTVYLKKVRYHRPTKSASSDSEDEISHLEWETVRVRFVKAGTVERLVEALATDDGELESTYINVFLATYRSFCDPGTVLQLLLGRYEALVDADDPLQPAAAELADQHRRTLVSALHVWLDSYPEDFRHPPTHPVLHQLIAFTKVYLPGSELNTKAMCRLEQWSGEEGGSEGGDWGSGPVCLAPGMRLAQHHVHAYRFPDVPQTHFAEQLTRMDMELFKKLVPHQCLGAIWSRRDKNRSHEAATVVATVNQFNAVSFRVISTILIEPKLRPQDRADIISTWIDIAQELRILKNFSSLKAIISGLQSNPIYRLQKTWALIIKEKMELFDELARIFSEENNQWAQRELLMREGTAKFADTVGENDKQLQKAFQKHNIRSGNISHGTIPYLGTFLTDLTMIDTAIPDTIMDGLVNFDKRRKEFEVLAQIKLLQGAANAYHLPQDPMFDRWFDSILVLDDREAYQISCQIEPSTNQPIRDKRQKKLNNSCPQGHRKNDSIASTSSSNSSQFYCDLDHSTTSSKNNSLDRQASPSQMSSGSSSSSIPSLDVSLSSANSGNSKTLQVPKPNKNSSNHNVGTGTLSPNHSQKSSPDFYIIRVTYETDNVETDGVVMYKSIMLSNNERTPQVIRNAMLKLNLEGNPEEYTLSQVLPEKEMMLPSNANVYYAVNTAYNLNFILRPKRSNNSLESPANGKVHKIKK